MSSPRQSESSEYVAPAEFLESRRLAKKANDAKYYAAHREEIKARNAKYNAAHPEQTKACSKKHYAAHREERKAKKRLDYWKKQADQAMHTFLNAGPEARDAALEAVTKASKKLEDTKAELAAIEAAKNTDAGIVQGSGMDTVDTFEARVLSPEEIQSLGLPVAAILPGTEVHGSDNFGNPVLDIDIPEQEPTFLDAEISMLHATMHAASGNEPDDNPFSPIPPVAFSHTIFPGPAFQQGNAGFNETDPFAFLNNDFDVNGNESTHGPG